MMNAMTVRASSFTTKDLAPRRSYPTFVWMAAAVLAAIAVAAVLLFDYYQARLGIVGPSLEVVETGAQRIIRVPPGGNVQAALNRAVAGDLIELQAGAVYKGPLKLPKKSGAEFITIRTSANDGQLPPAGTRLDPKRYAASLARIQSNVKGEPAITCAPGAHHYRFIGIEFGPTIDGLFDIIQIGTSAERTPEELPSHIEFDRVYMHGDPHVGQRRGIAANGRHIKITNSYFSDFKREGDESQAIAVWAADGPLEVTNNYLEASSESILFGGAESHLGLIPGNAVIRDNHFNKPLEWRGTKWLVKNFIEIKSGRNIRITNNLMTNNWEMGQEGTGVLFRTGEDSGKNCVVEDMLFENNIVRGSGSAVMAYGGECPDGGRRLTIRNNVFEDISKARWGGRGFFLKSSAWKGLVIENNTVIQDGFITMAWGEPSRDVVFRNNIIFQNDGGFFGDGFASGRATMARYFPGIVVTGNAIIGGSHTDYGSGNFYPANAGKIGFADAAHGDYRVNSGQFSEIGADLDPRDVGGR